MSGVAGEDGVGRQGVYCQAECVWGRGVVGNETPRRQGPNQDKKLMCPRCSPPTFPTSHPQPDVQYQQSQPTQCLDGVVWGLSLEQCFCSSSRVQATYSRHAGAASASCTYKLPCSDREAQPGNVQSASPRVVVRKCGLNALSAYTRTPWGRSCSASPTGTTADRCPSQGETPQGVGAVLSLGWAPRLSRQDNALATNLHGNALQWK